MKKGCFDVIKLGWQQKVLPVKQNYTFDVDRPAADVAGRLSKCRAKMSSLGELGREREFPNSWLKLGKGRGWLFFQGAVHEKEVTAQNDRQL